MNGLSNRSMCKTMHNQLLSLVGLAVFLTAAVGCAGPASRTTNIDARETHTGFIHYNSPGFQSIGGPEGYVLVGGHGFKRLYLRRQGSLESDMIATYAARFVTVEGRVSDMVDAGLPPERTLAVMDVEDIRYADEH